MEKWTNEEINHAIKLNLDGLKYDEIGTLLNRTTKSTRVKLNRLGYSNNDNTYYIDVICECCSIKFKSKKSENRKYCSQSCSASINNKKYPKRNDNIFITDDNLLNETERNKYFKEKHNICLYCGNLTNNIYCSRICCSNHKEKKIQDDIENGNITYPSKQYKKYLINKYGNKCMECGWDKINNITGNVPIELDHKDGNSKNNSLNNLTLLCPNCHSLTSTFRALNKGNGRHSKMNRYKSGKSY